MKQNKIVADLVDQLLDAKAPVTQLKEPVEAEALPEVQPVAQPEAKPEEPAQKIQQAMLGFMADKKKARTKRVVKKT